MTLRNGEHRQYNQVCPFDCTDWDECVCENTAIHDGSVGGKYFFTSDEVMAMEENAEKSPRQETP